MKIKKINIKGAIIPNNDKWIYDLLDMEGTCPKDITGIVNESSGEDIELTINSPGGDVFSASEIYTELRNHDAKVKSRIVGVAASAASVIAMAGEVEMSPTAQVMIHKASTIGMGNSDDFTHTADFLDKIDKSICNAYMHKTGMEQQELLNLMQKETWMSADEAKEKGFVDSIMFDQPKAVASASGVLPDKVVNLIRNQHTQSALTIDDIRTVVNEMKEELKAELKEEPKPVQNNWLF